MRRDRSLKMVNEVYQVVKKANKPLTAGAVSKLMNKEHKIALCECRDTLVYLYDSGKLEKSLSNSTIFYYHSEKESMASLAKRFHRAVFIANKRHLA